jgi:phosphohistidine swiveling domain-containing protein
MLVAGDVDVAELQRVGGKAAGLALLRRLGIRCPEFFVVTADAFRAHLRKGETPAALGEAMLAFAELEDGRMAPGDVAELSARLRAAVESVPLDAELVEGIEAATGQLGPGPYAVRSSMVGEDSARHSFAGLLESRLFQPTPADVLDAVRQCWASAFGERVLVYAVRAGVSPVEVRLGVIVQQMVDAEVAGVAFSVNPVSGRRDECLITATYGLGEGVVEDLVAADEFVWSPDGGERSASVATKDREIVQARSGRGTEQRRTSAQAREQRALSLERVAEVGTLTRRVAAGAGYPVDLEWAYAGGVLHALQSRPITSLPRERDERAPGRVLDNSNIQESFNGVTTPLTFSFASRVYATVFSDLLRTLGASRRSLEEFEPASRTLLAIVAGRVYYNLDSWRALYHVFPGGGRRIEEVETVMWHTAIGSGPAATRPLGQRLRRAVEVIEFASRMALGFVRLDREIKGFVARFQSIYDSIDRRHLPDRSLVELYEMSRRLQTELLREWHIPNLNDFRVIMLCGHLHRLLGRFYEGQELDARLADLLGGIEGIESVEPTRLLVAIAQAARCDAVVVTALRTLQPDAALKVVRERAPGVAAQIDDYVERYGDRTIGELKLETVTAREDPEFLVGVLRSYLDRPVLDPSQLTTAERERYRTTLTEVKRRLPPWRRPLLEREVALARKAVHAREALRLRRTLAFGLARDVYGAMGVRLHEEQLIDDPRDVFYITVDELEAFVEGRAVSVQLAPLVSVRKQEWKAYRAQEPANRIEVVGSPYIGNDLRDHPAASANSENGALRGLGCCGGVVEAPVRLVREPRDGLGMNGEILCTLRTDPGWAPLFFTASGLIVERGSVLSHSAILARELGLPTVVGIPGITKLLRDGERVRLDGEAGVVERLETATVTQ